MTKYLVVEEQDTDGCDFTIGCGTRTSQIEIPDGTDVVKWWVTKQMEDYEIDGVLFENPFGDPETKLKKLCFYELTVGSELDKMQLESISEQIDEVVAHNRANE